ncbi:invasion associated locus B family protein [Erythrobacter mangrovi]|uniref:Invasion associated locus B family protein n=1 Tax=Erythrobacter mangrovi TaxID=2739433 RepID=A0A7D4BGX4_9SPHN|nr:invasion associated locus B family protein [Erythrobacter mangrovi]QKG71862.1 hypothetical protein HQR01_11125 [Erythrobacter mangrovi]
MRKLIALTVLALAAPLAAKDDLGVFSDWGAFRDPSVPRCYAIAVPEASRLSRDFSPFATIATWPRRNLRGQVHFRLSRRLATNGAITLQIGNRSFRLTGGGGDAWARDRTMDATIVAAMRSASRMTIRASDTRGRRFSNTYSLSGAATAMDAATLACARLGR